MNGQKNYDFGAFCEQDQYVRTHFPGLSASAFHVYHTGLPHLERILKVGIGGRVIVDADKWAEASGVTAKTAGNALRELADLGLVEFKPGSSRPRRCNSVRRKMLSDIQSHLSPEILHATIPQRAEGLANRLGQIPIAWKGETLTPTYSVAKTGRIYMSAPNLQSSPEQERFPNLAHCLPDGWILTSCDYKAAEPSILFHALRQQGYSVGVHVPERLYQNLASLRGIKRQEAKRALLELFYSPWRDISIPADWSIPKTDPLQDVVLAVNEYRHHLWEAGAPKRPETRHVSTLFGRKISARPREKLHRGKLLSWHIQGTVADIFLEALSRVLDEHDEGRLKFCLQLHDSMIVASPPTGANLLQDIMEGVAKAKGHRLLTETKHHQTDRLVKGVILPPCEVETVGVNLRPKGERIICDAVLT